MTDADLCSLDVSLTIRFTNYKMGEGGWIRCPQRFLKIVIM